MPIKNLLQYSAFEPEAVEAMGTAFEEALSALGITDRADPLATTVAKKIIELAQQGERDPDRLRDLTIRAFTK